ncbi:aspartate aminotransferase family protein [Amycolatopsis sp. WAC 01376]|uniref:daptide-type RiPP biosynthesis aminotransferase n=1 Tax=Amycolatopsis sp. WAC 01376 TaxID=2203195 RepID=UPI000F79994C|nr:daptide-type RiPP biosynthesis aminotransferase [Amycolatopsis sp. WAC 01376]RSM63048.1 aspartate aminotransferase family protein [Amycolatopsis sp. WAC 01376]
MPERYPVWESLIPPSEYGKPERHAVSAQGTRVRFADGSWALCATSGLWNVNLGYGNRAIADAVGESLNTASYLSLFRGGHDLAVRAANALLAVCGPEQYGRVLFSTSGGAANDAMMKLVRHCQALRGEEPRRVVVGLKGSYHGLTYGGFSLTGEELGQRGYGVDQRAVRHVGHHDEVELETLLAREGHRVAAVVLEPVLGSGAYEVSDRLINALGRLRAEHGFLLVADEVATGFGRTGPYFASQDWPVRPDVLVTSKGLTNGTCAASAVVVSHEVCEDFERADAVLVHGETQAGSPSSCAAVLAMVEEMARLEAVELAARNSARLGKLLDRLTAHPMVTGHRGRGCFRAVELTGRSAEVMAVARRSGLIVQPGPDCVQLVPALTYTEADFEELEALLVSTLDEVAA